MEQFKTLSEWIAAAPLSLPVEAFDRAVAAVVVGELEKQTALLQQQTTLFERIEQRLAAIDGRLGVV